MKKVEITKSCSGIRFTFQQGEVVDIDDRLADDLIRAKFAIAVDTGETQIVNLWMVKLLLKMKRNL